MGLRPAHTCRTVSKQSWTRYSKKRPRQSYVKSMPHNAVQITSMGNPVGAYTHRIDLVAEVPIQVRDNSLESARQAVNKLLEAKIPNAYHLFVRVQPHQVIREIKMVFGAGADRIQKGMKHAWGRPSDRAARIHPGTPIFTARTTEQNLAVVKEGYRRAKIKLPGVFVVKVTKETRPAATPAEEAEVAA